MNFLTATGQKKPHGPFNQKVKTVKKVTGRRKPILKPASKTSIPASSIILNARQALKTDTEAHENDEGNVSSSLAS